jgi:hypothetical protein
MVMINYNPQIKTMHFVLIIGLTYQMMLEKNVIFILE